MNHPMTDRGCVKCGRVPSYRPNFLCRYHKGREHQDYPAHPDGWKSILFRGTMDSFTGHCKRHGVHYGMTWSRVYEYDWSMEDAFSIPSGEKKCSLK